MENEEEGGNLNERVILKKLMNKIVNGEVKHLFVYENDRLSRNENLWNYIRIKLKENDVTLYTKSTTLNLSDKKDDLFFGILSEFSKFENELRSERLKEGRRQKVKKGYWYGGGKGVFGYDVIEKRLVISKYESKWVRNIMKMYGDGVKISDIILNLRENNVKTKRGNLVFSDGSIEKIVRNTYYLGYFHYLDDRIENESLRFIDDDEELYKNVLIRVEFNRKRK
jgi:DNA invertase Pin-like site-specific DNA recombinase